MSVQIRVLLAEPIEVARIGLTSALDAEPDVSVTGAYDSVMQAVEVAELERPDIAVLALEADAMSGIEATRAIATMPDAATNVIAIGSNDGRKEVLDALAAGANGFLMRDASASEFVRAVRAVAAGHAFITPHMTRVLLDQIAHLLPLVSRGPTPDISGLTSREKDVLLLMTRGLANSDIASALSISTATVRSHVYSIFQKLNVRHRTQAVAHAFSTGFASPVPRSAARFLH